MIGDSHTVVAPSKVVVVEDDASMRRAIQRLLDAAGFESVVYASAEGALANRIDQEAACVVSDLKLPGMSGLDLLARLRTQGASPPLILITAHDAPGRREETVRAGAAAYLAKPFAGTALLDLIRGLIQPVGSR
jgi:FixJ family two-component response regulator